MADEDNSKPGNSMKECHICGATIKEDEDYCPECGEDFKEVNKYNY
ncbi:MAG: hypothetical protein V1906_00660 [Candidatus Woesearchaeota archaeon]